MASNSSRKPNYLLIVADDLGFSDVGCFGSEIQTPAIDSLARDGTRFTNFHASSACSPTRSMIMTGTDHHLTGLGQMAEFLIENEFRAHRGMPGHEGYLNNHCATLPEVLRLDGGYHTIMSGKWHLGLRPEHSPATKGFDKSFSLCPPAANHYAWEPEIDPEKRLPRFAELNVAALHIEDGEWFKNSNLPEDFYSSDFYADKLMTYLDARPKEKPFFAYLPFSAPHWPLQAPQDSIKKYRGFYDSGPEELRQKRLASLKQLGLVPHDVQAHPVVAPEVPEWEDMTDSQRQKSARAMEAFAGMVDRMDYNIGRVINYLKKNGLYDNTQIIFMSDNGAEGCSYEAAPLTGPDTMGYIKAYYNNALDNIGNKDSFVWYGGRWAQAATAPSRLYKKFSTEGGIRVPFILKPAKGQYSYNASISHDFCTVMDLMPTMLDAVGISIPKGHYNGRPINPIRGTSWAPFLRGEIARPHPEDYVAGWELFGDAALRKGDWKINFVGNTTYGKQRWELHDLARDPGETTDLSDTYPEKLEELLVHWRQYAQEVGVVGLKTEFPELLNKSEMENPTAWMNLENKIETSRGVALELKKKGMWV